MGQIHWKRYPKVANHLHSQAWLLTNINLAPNTIDAYGRGLEDYLSFCARNNFDPRADKKEQIALWINDLNNRPNIRCPNELSLGVSPGLSIATIQQKLTAVRLYYEYLIEEGVCQRNPVGRGKFSLNDGHCNKRERGILRRAKKIPWIPNEEQWQAILNIVKTRSLRTRLMFTLQYDCALRREELCSLKVSDIDPIHRTVSIRPETTKSKRPRVIMYSDITSMLYSEYIMHRPKVEGKFNDLFLSESRRNYAEPITIWTWSKVVKSIARCADVVKYTTHTSRHLRLTDLARAAWDIKEIAVFAGHTNPETTQIYIHLSCRDIKQRFERSMASIRTWREAKMRELNI
jgi:integrase/recombinase XerD